MMAWSWIWPPVGPTPVNQGLDSEIFDRADFPYSETFVREAIQNSLDARLDSEKPVRIKFSFHEGRLAGCRALLHGAIEHRKAAGLPIPADWESGKCRWLVVQDFNTRGLLGDLSSRSSDFWNYWLNFGISNKGDGQRGGRGIGRVTFLIASEMRAVIGLTRRFDDPNPAGCGMVVLQAGEHGDDYKSTHAYLASNASRSIYSLHDSVEFWGGIEKAFELESYTEAPDLTGLALAIPYPHADLNVDGIVASAVEHFAPAILSGSLIVQADNYEVNVQTMEEIAVGFASDVRSKTVGGDLHRYLGLIDRGLNSQAVALSLASAALNGQTQRATDLATTLQEQIESGSTIVIDLCFPLLTSRGSRPASVRAVIAKVPYGKPPIDRLFREGMSLPAVKCANPGDLDLVLLVGHSDLAAYLNLCEGKAHLDLEESQEVREKLAERGFEDGVKVRRFIKALPRELRTMLTAEISKPDDSVFAGLFSVADPAAPSRKGVGKKPSPPPSPPPPAPTPRIQAVRTDTLDDGFRILPNDQFNEWPVRVTVTIAYADGSRKPAWSEFDFPSAQLNVTATKCDYEFTRNRLVLNNWTVDSEVEVRGFDPNRELDLSIGVSKDAPQD